MKIYAIRHTSVAVEPGICYGKSDVGLASGFPEEMQKVKDQLKSRTVAAVYSSPLSRCTLLAETLFESSPIQFDKRLKEMNFGDWELMSWEAIYKDPEGKVWMDNYQTYPTKNGESYPEMIQRVAAFLAELRNQTNQPVAIVAHAGVIRIFKHLIEGVSIAELFETFKPDYGSITELEFSDE